MVTFFIFLSAIVLAVLAFILFGLHYDDEIKTEPFKESWILVVGILCVFLSLNNFCVSINRTFTFDSKPTQTISAPPTQVDNSKSINAAALTFRGVITAIDTDGVWIGPTIKIQDHIKDARTNRLLEVGDTLIIK